MKVLCILDESDVIRRPAPNVRPLASEPEASGRRTITASLFRGDLAALEVVRDLIYEHANERGDRSLAIKLALRLAAKFATGDRVREILGQIRAEDGRSSSACAECGKGVAK